MRWRRRSLGRQSRGTRRGCAPPTTSPSAKSRYRDCADKQKGGDSVSNDIPLVAGSNPACPVVADGTSGKEPKEAVIVAHGGNDTISGAGGQAAQRRPCAGNVPRLSAVRPSARIPATPRNRSGQCQRQASASLSGDRSTVRQSIRQPFRPVSHSGKPRPCAGFVATVRQSQTVANMERGEHRTRRQFRQASASRRNRTPRRVRRDRSTVSQKRPPFDRPRHHRRKRAATAATVRPSPA